DNQRVRGGDLLVELDDDIARTKVAQAEATLAAETSAAAAAEADAVVAVRLAKGNRGMSEAQLASARVSVDAARDQIREAEVAREAAHAEERRTAADLLRTQKLANTGTASVAELEHVEADHRQAAFALEQADLRISNVRNAVVHAATRETEATAKLYGTHVEALVDQASRRAQAARARVGVADAALLLARLELDYTKIRSPADGIVSKRSVTVGQMVDVGQPVVQLIATQRLWVTANFKETQLKEMRAGQGVRLKFDVEPSTEYSGVVENFSGATGARFALLPPDNATGNFTKVVQRVPVRIRLGDVALPLNLIPGVSVEATVLTR
ncbi:MAG TPA: HlyD family secretion protein, partial [Polyangiaceae bacterium]|nr:HlyD family secretion protein [Polyangiaceae bacterium]